MLLHCSIFIDIKSKKYVDFLKDHADRNSIYQENVQFNIKLTDNMD